MISTDVRMRGFKSLTPVREVYEFLNNHSRSICPECVPIQQAAGRVLVHDLNAPINVPDFARSAMDGFAICQASATSLIFNMMGEAKAGQGFQGTIGPNECVRIMTGAPIPAGADTVVPVELTAKTENFIEIQQTIPTGKNIITIGEDIKLGEPILHANRRLRPQDIGLISSLGISSIAVHRRPRVAIIISGNEVLPAGSTPLGHRIPDSSSVMLQGLIERDGGLVSKVAYIADDPEPLQQELNTIDGDLLITCGGTSVGADDHLPALVAAKAIRMIHGINMKPGMPTGVASVDSQKLIFMLPGNPLASLVAYELFVGYTIRKWGGLPAAMPYPTIRGQLSKRLESKIGRLDYVPLEINGIHLNPLNKSGPANLSNAVRADGFLLITEELEMIEEKQEFQAYRYG